MSRRRQPLEVIIQWSMKQKAVLRWVWLSYTCGGFSGCGYGSGPDHIEHVRKPLCGCTLVPYISQLPLQKIRRIGNGLSLMTIVLILQASQMQHRRWFCALRCTVAAVHNALVALSSSYEASRVDTEEKKSRQNMRRQFEPQHRVNPPFGLSKSTPTARL